MITLGSIQTAEVGLGLVFIAGWQLPPKEAAVDESSYSYWLYLKLQVYQSYSK